MSTPKRGRPGAPDLRLAAAHVSTGIAVGLLLLHPVTMAVYWFEFHPQITGVDSVWDFVWLRVGGAFSPGMLPMSAVFAVLGALLGGGSAVYAAHARSRNRRVLHLEQELGRALPALIAAGEGERVEFKATARWDLRESCHNRALGDTIARSVAGFANAAGGTILIGVDDSGDVVGLERDYETLHSSDRDGFERFLMDLIATSLGADVCRLVHVVLHRVGGLDICRLAVEPAPRPVFINSGGRSRYYVRTGNATREFDVREALRHVAGSR